MLASIVVRYFIVEKLRIRNGNELEVGMIGSACGHQSYLFLD